MYIRYASPWTHDGDTRAMAAIGHIVADHETLSRRIAVAIFERHGVLNPGEYPMSFTGIHDVSLDYLVLRLIECQRADLAAIEQCIADLRDDPQARATAEECLGAARGHLESLEELVGAAK
jgi:hypothetical protein